jgi:3-deoxy-7-phosphoheptulonate synthase
MPLTTQNLHVREIIPLISPNELKRELPLTETASLTVVRGRNEITRILAKEDQRLLVVVGPCSIHDSDAASEYAHRLNELRHGLSDRLCIVMRVYFEKPRTTTGWKGLINDPRLDGSYDIEAGLKTARRLLLEINELGLSAATEFLDPIVPQYMADLIAWAAVGARTTESQTHREMASGLSMPVGFKNGTDGSLQIAIDALQAARTPHSFLGIDQNGTTSIIRTTGNPVGHLVLRGGRSGPNYDPDNIARATRKLRDAGLPDALMVDCSHANSGKKYTHQAQVWKNLLDQRAHGSRLVIGAMLESNLQESSQAFPQPVQQLRRGVSITDACIGWDETERLLQEAYHSPQEED